MDFSTAFCDGEGQVQVQRLTIPNQLGAMPDGMAAILKHYRGQIEPGDVFILNMKLPAACAARGLTGGRQGHR